MDEKLYVYYKQTRLSKKKADILHTCRKTMNVMGVFQSAACYNKNGNDYHIITF